MSQSDVYMKELGHDINNKDTEFSILALWMTSQSCHFTSGSWSVRLGVESLLGLQLIYSS